MTQDEIKAAVEAGKTVHWATSAYVVIKDQVGQWLIRCTLNDYYIGLTWSDGATLNGQTRRVFHSHRVTVQRFILYDAYRLYR